MKALLFILLLLCHGAAFSQWTTSGNNISYTKGLVGIGVSPTFPLHIKSTLSTEFFVGESPEVQFSFSKNSFQLKPIGSFNQTPSIVWYAPGGRMQAILGTRTDGLGLQMQSGNPFLITGNVGIGVNNTAGYMLAVGGKFIAEEVVVKLKAAWPDYVFDSDYSLLPLRSLSEYLKVNRHLPGVPTSSEVSAAGINTGEIVPVLLQKIEELTIYLIEQEETAAELRKRIEVLEKSLVNSCADENN